MGVPHSPAVDAGLVSAVGARLPGAIRKLLLALGAAVLLHDSCAATQLLSINMTAQDRQFLIDNKQKVAIVLPVPASGDNSSVVVAMVLQPIANLTRVAFEQAPVLYLAYAPIGAFDTVRMAQQTRVAYGQAYSFDGVRVNGEGNGVGGAVGIYFNAPNNTVPPVVAGLAAHMYDVAVGKQQNPAPLNFFLLNRYETRLIPQPGPLAWVFIGTDLGAGSVLPLALLKPVPLSTPAPAAGPATAGQAPPALQIGRYLSVKLDATEPANIYFDINGNAFSYTADPQQ